MARLIGEKALNTVVAHIDGVHDALRDQAIETEAIAKRRLESARATTEWVKLADPDHLTEINVTEGDIDFFVNMEGYKQGPMAIEFGHAPSGIFGPGGKFGHVKTKAPYGLYIMTGAWLQS